MSQKVVVWIGGVEHDCEMTSCCDSEQYQRPLRAVRFEGQLIAILGGGEMIFLVCLAVHAIESVSTI